MSSNIDVESYVNDPTQLLFLCREVVARLEERRSNDATAAMETQLREIARTIDRLTQQKVPVPEVLRAEKTRLAAALGACTEAAQPLKLLRDGLEELLQKLNAGPPRPLEATVSKKSSASHSKSPKTHRTILRKLIIEELSALGGSASKGELYTRIEKKYEGKFLPGDFEYLPDGKRIAWKNYCDWEGTLLRKEGLLKSNSPRGLWELSEGQQ